MRNSAVRQLIRIRLLVLVQQRRLYLWGFKRRTRQDEVLRGSVNTKDSNDRSKFPEKRVPSRINVRRSRYNLPKTEATRFEPKIWA